MSEFKILDNRTAEEKAAGKRSARAQAAAALASGSDVDAYMALQDFADESRAEGEFVGGADRAQLGENKTRHAVPGRPDLEFIRGNGIGGCRYIVVSRVPVQPASVYVQRKSWADEEEDQDEVVEQTVSVLRTR